MNNGIELINQFCADIGQNPLIVQGAGGNLSWKDGSILWVKGSGAWLRDAKKSNIFVPINLDKLNSGLSRNDYLIDPELIGSSELSPSIETLLHAVMPHKIVLHLHPVEVLAHAVRADFDKNLSQTFRFSIDWECIPYLKPGSELAKAAARALAKNSNLKVLFLQNHGIVIGGESIESVNKILFTVNNSLAVSPYYSKMHFSVPEFLNVNERWKYIAIKDPEIQALVFDQVLFSRLQYDWCISPDHVVFLGQRAFTYDSIESFVKFEYASDEYPDLIFIRNVGVYITAKFSIQKLLLLRCYGEIMIRQAPQQTLTKLSSAEVQELLGWDAEKKRVNLSQKYKTR